MAVATALRLLVKACIADAPDRRPDGPSRLLDQPGFDVLGPRRREPAIVRATESIGRSTTAARAALAHPVAGRPHSAGGGTAREPSAASVAILATEMQPTRSERQCNRPLAQRERGGRPAAASLAAIWSACSRSHGAPSGSFVSCTGVIDRGIRRRSREDAGGRCLHPRHGGQDSRGARQESRQCGRCIRAVRGAACAATRRRRCRPSCGGLRRREAGPGRRGRRELACTRGTGQTRIMTRRDPASIDSRSVAACVEISFATEDAKTMTQATAAPGTPAPAAARRGGPRSRSSR